MSSLYSLYCREKPLLYRSYVEKFVNCLEATPMPSQCLTTPNHLGTKATSAFSSFIQVGECDPIACNLKLSNLDRNPTYEALSYCWGPPPDLASICLDGEYLMVRENLWWALKHLRFKDQERDLWIDALCIDQSRPEEKNHQVQLMGHIYSKAFQVLIWLGQEGEDSDVAMECMIDVLQNKYYLRDYDNRELNALRKLFARDYWSRMWILQEVVLAACLTIHCGSKSFKWRALYELYLITPLLEEPGHTTRTVIDARENHWHPNGQISNTLSSLLSRCYHRKVTDQKDTIYAILGIASDCQNGEIQVDYSRSIPELCSDLLFLHGKSRRPRNDLSSTTLDFFEDLLDWILRIESARRLPERETWPPVPRGWPYNIEQANERGRQMNGESFELQRLAEPHPSAWKARKAL